MAEEIISGYRLVNCLYPGQTSEVWEVVETGSHRHFAMKLLLKDFAQKPEHRRFLLHEAKVGKELAHPNIIRIVQASSDKKNPFIVMEYFPAGSLKSRMLRKQFDFIRERLHSILKQAATALAFVNSKGWVHRDVKPDNMLVNNSGDLRLIDFALAQRIQKNNFWTRLFRSKVVQGTRSYMSPEQIRADPLDARADIYSFGVTAFELSTRKLPFTGASNKELLTKHLTEKASTPQMVNPEITDEFADLVLRMLAKKPDKRPSSFQEVLSQLNSIRVYKNDPPPSKD